MAKSLKHATLVNLFNGRAKLADVLDNVEQKLIAQGKGAYENHSCQYFTNDGCSCAVGVILPKDSKSIILKAAANGNSAGIMLSKVGDKLGVKLNSNTAKYRQLLNVLNDLQNVHDTAATHRLVGSEWGNRIKKRMAELRLDHAELLKDC